MSYKEDPIFDILQKLHHGDELQYFLATTWEAWGEETPRFIQTTPIIIEYQPFESAWVLIEAAVGLSSGIVDLDMIVQVFTSPESAEQIANASRLHPVTLCGGPPMFTHPQWGLVGWTLPNCPDQQKIRQLLQPNALSRLMEGESGLSLTAEQFHEPTLHRYVPFKGTVISWQPIDDGVPLFARIGDDETSMAAYSNLAKIHAATQRCQPEFQTPVPIHYCKGLHASIFTGIPGIALSQIMRDGPISAFFEAGRALASLHRSPVAALSLRTIEQEIAELMYHMNCLRYALPEFTPRLAAVINRLSETGITVTKDTAVPIHGNPSCDEILYDDGRVGSINWESLALGDPLHDIGRLAADIIYLASRKKIRKARALDCLEALAYGYREVSGEPLDSELLAWHLTSSLLVQAKFQCLRQLRKDWEHHIHFIIEEAERTLEKKSIYVNAMASQHESTLTVSLAS